MQRSRKVQNVERRRHETSLAVCMSHFASPSRRDEWEIEGRVFGFTRYLQSSIPKERTLNSTFHQLWTRSQKAHTAFGSSSGCGFGVDG